MFTGCLCVVIKVHHGDTVKPNVTGWTTEASSPFLCRRPRWRSTQPASVCLHYHPNRRQGGPAARTQHPSTHAEGLQAAGTLLWIWPLTSDLPAASSPQPAANRSTVKASCLVHAAAAATVRIWVDQDLDGDSSDGVEGAEDVQSGCGTETEDGLPFVQDYEGLQERQRQKHIFLMKTNQTSCSRVLPPFSAAIVTLNTFTLREKAKFFRLCLQIIRNNN